MKGIGAWLLVLSVLVICYSLWQPFRHNAYSVKCYLVELEVTFAAINAKTQEPAPNACFFMSYTYCDYDCRPDGKLVAADPPRADLNFDRTICFNNQGEFVQTYVGMNAEEKTSWFGRTVYFSVSVPDVLLQSSNTGYEWDVVKRPNAVCLKKGTPGKASIRIPIELTPAPE